MSAAELTLAATENSVRQDSRVIGLVGLAHAFSHYFHLLLPPLFPWLMPEFGLDYARIGVTMTVFFVISGVGQAVTGLVVDKIGPVRVLALGLSCFVLAGVGLSLVQGYGGLIAVAALAGLGNSVFHPADFSLLNRRVSHSRLPHAFSVHGLSGNVGWAAAPMVMTGVATFGHWRWAGLISALAVLPVILLLLVNRQQLEGEASTSQDEKQHGTFAFLRVGAVWMCFAFFLFLTMAFGAIQNFASPVLGGLYGLGRGEAATALSAYMLAGAVGIVIGGFLAKHRSQDAVIAMALVAAALLACLLASSHLPSWSILPLMVVIGFLSGTAGPSRDMLVRRAATARFGQAAYGRIYGFVYSGLDVGLATAPLIFGGFMDRGHFATVLVGIAILQGLAVLAALKVGRQS